MICLKWRVKKREEPTTKNTQKDSFRFDGEIKNFPDKQKLREFSITKPALQQMLRKFSRQETQEEERLTQDKPQAIKKMVIESYISIIILSENGLMYQPKDTDWADENMFMYALPLTRSLYLTPQIICNYFTLLG